jgi:hypothetical protein
MAGRLSREGERRRMDIQEAIPTHHPSRINNPYIPADQPRVINTLF